MPKTIPITLTLQNVEGLQKALERGLQVKSFLQGEVKRFAFLVERGAKQVTPVDTGRLRASIKVDIGNLKARVAPNVFYDIFVHEGTRFMRARPFLFWGVQTAQRGFDRRSAARLERAIQKILIRTSTIGKPQAAAQKAAGRGFLADFDSAFNAGDLAKARSIMNSAPQEYRSGMQIALGAMGK